MSSILLYHLAKVIPTFLLSQGESACPNAEHGCTFSTTCVSAHQRHFEYDCEFVRQCCPRGGPDCGGNAGEEQGVYWRREREAHEQECSMWR
jgi:hypothetical protein